MPCCSPFRKKPSPKTGSRAARFRSLVTFLLTITTLILLVSGVMISNVVFRFLGIPYQEFWHYVHFASGVVFSPGGRFLSGPFNPLYYSLAIHDKGFTVSDTCVSCGMCAQRCPLNNIDMVNGKPMWKGCCTHCMACICGCPTEAIEYKSISKGKRRYYIMDDALCWGNGGKVN